MIKIYTKYAVIVIIMGISTHLFSQSGNISMNIAGNKGSSTAILDLSDVSNAHLGFLMPKVGLTGPNDNTTIPSPVAGLIVWDTTTAPAMPLGIGFYYWDGSHWDFLYNSGSAVAGSSLTAGTGIIPFTYNGTAPATVGLANTAIAPGGTYGSATIVPQITVNAQGQITGESNQTITPASIGMQNHTPGTGLTGSAYNGSTAINNWAVAYGNVAGTAVQGNTTITVTAGTGLSGGGTITEGSGGSVTLTNAGVNSITANTPAYITGTAIAPVVNVQGNASGTDKGGVLYSTGAATSAVFTPTGTSGYIFQSNGTSAPAFVNPTSLTGNFILNQTAPQTSSNFNISGAGVIGTTLGVSGLTTLSGGLTETGSASINGSGTANTTIGNNSNAANTVTLASGSTGGVNVNASTNSPTNINTGTSTGAIAIGNNSTTTLTEAATTTNINAATGTASATNIGTGSTTGAVKIGSTGGTFFPQMATQYGVYYSGTATGQISQTAASTGANQVLTTVTSGGVPTWGTDPAIATSWEITGNGNITDGTNFLGTTNSAPINFQVNGIKAGRIDINQQNTFLGLYSGAQITSTSTTATQNVELGYFAGYDLINGGIGNVGIGAYANQYVGTGTYNVGIGYGSYYSAAAYTTGSYNNAIGYQANYEMTSGGYNNAIGYQAGYLFESNSYNDAIGYTASYSNTGANYTEAMGYQALYNNTGAGNVGIGYKANFTNTTGTYNTALGYNASVGSAALTNATAIGANASVTASNALVLGSGANVGVGISAPTAQFEVATSGDIPYALLNTTSTANKRVRLQYGYNGTIAWELATDISVNNSDNMYFYDRITGTFGPVILNNGYVGIGTTNPLNRLDIGGASAIGTYAGANVAPANGMIVSGTVGIGTPTPNAKLDVVGPSTGNGAAIYADGGGDLLLAAGGALFFDGNYNYAAGNYIRPIATNTQQFVTSGVERMRITSTGNIGIGNTAPTFVLDVSGSATTGIRYIKNAADARVTIGDPTQSWSWSTGWATGGDFSLIQEGIAGNIIYASHTNHNVGITTSTPAPSAALDVTSTTQGFLPPRMTTAQMNAIAGPAQGLMVFNTTTNCVMVYTGTWQSMFCPTCASNIIVLDNTAAIQSATVGVQTLTINTSFPNEIIVISSSNYNAAAYIPVTVDGNTVSNITTAGNGGGTPYGVNQLQYYVAAAAGAHTISVNFSSSNSNTYDEILAASFHTSCGTALSSANIGPSATSGTASINPSSITLTPTITGSYIYAATYNYLGSTITWGGTSGATALATGTIGSGFYASQAGKASAANSGQTVTSTGSNSSALVGVIIHP